MSRAGKQWLPALLFVAGCLDGNPPEGALLCASAPPQCPSGYACAPDGTCWLAGDSGLRATWQGQEQPSWAGPAATRIALSTLLTSPPDQMTLAQALGTTTAGTNDIGLVSGVLDRFTNSTWFMAKLLPDPPSEFERAQLKLDIVYNIDHAHPLVANVVSGFRPPGYPPGPIYHYVTIIGYRDHGNQVLIADPGGEGAAGAAWSAVPRTYWISVTDLGTWIGGKGYAA